MKIKYLGNYGITLKNREFSPATVTKMDYIISALNKNLMPVKIISQSSTKIGEKSSSCQKIEVKKNVELQLFYSLGTQKKIIKKISNLLIKIQLFFYLLVTLKRNEKIIVYHSLSLYYPLIMLKKLKKFKLILEVNEIYSDVNKNDLWRKKEFNLISKADGYIFINKYLNEKLNKQKKPYLINHGTYKTNLLKKEEFGDENIHVLYAGTLNKVKGGAYTACSIANYLPNNYHIHILGFGSKSEIEDINSLIKKIQNKNSCKITYDGMLIGKKYIEFIEKCHLGLSCQNPEGEYNETSFPSKILVYLAHGLKVVSININAVKSSKLKSVISFYDENTPEAIANKILEIKSFNTDNAINLLEKLDEEMIKEIGLFLKKI